MYMKMLFISNKNFIGESNFGGAQCAKRNYEMMVHIYGKENIKYIVMSDEIKEFQITEKGMTIKIGNSNLTKYANLLFGRDCFSLMSKKKIEKYVREIRPDIVFMDGSSFGFIGKMFFFDTKKIVFYHNIEKSYAWSRVVNTSPLCIIKFFSFWRNESYITKMADACICLNERDAKLLYANYKRPADFLLPISFNDIEKRRLMTEDIKTNVLLFVGSYFMPNIKGIRWFCKNVMPYVDKKLFIVGKRMELLREELETTNIKVIGTVDNLDKYYNKVEAVVMPIFVGDGMKVKTAEAMRYGKPIFATDEALEGYVVEGIDGIYRCNSATEFIKKINNNHIKGYSDEIRETFTKNYSTPSRQQTLEAFLKGKNLLM